MKFFITDENTMPSNVNMFEHATSVLQWWPAVSAVRMGASYVSLVQMFRRAPHRLRV
jgi:hypothetical protein